MGHSNPKLANGLKMKAFHESPYGDDVVSGLMNHQVDVARLGGSDAKLRFESRASLI